MCDWDFRDIYQYLQDAAACPELWPLLLAKLSSIVGGAGAGLFAADSRLAGPTTSPDLERMNEDYARDWHKADRRFEGVPLLESRGIFTDLDIVDEDEMRRDGYYQDFLGKHDRKWFAGIGFQAGDDVWCLSIQRRISQGAFQRDELRQLRSLWRPFSDAATLSRLIDKGRLPAMAQAFEHIGHAAILCEEDGRILEMNASAARMMSLYYSADVKSLHFPAVADQDRFRLLLSETVRPVRVETAPRTIVVNRTIGAPVLIRSIRLLGASRLIFSRASTLLLLRELPKTEGRSTVAATDATGDGG